MARKVTVTEVGPRDGFQIEHDFIPTATKIALINQLVEAGLPIIEFSSFVSPRAVPQLVDAAEVLAKLDRSRGTKFAALVPNARGAERAAAAGVDEIRVFMSASETHNQKNVNRSIEQSLAGFEEVMRIANQSGIPVEGAIATAFGCPFEGEVPVEQVSAIAARFRDLGMRGVSLGDTTGMATPPLVVERCRHLKEHVSELPIALHFHNTRGIGLVNVMAGLAEDIDVYEASFAGLGGCPFAAGATGNICTEDLVHMLENMGHDTGIDLDRLIHAARGLPALVGHEVPGQVMKAGKSTELHPLPAGMR